jgi:polysaccharide pyruvyl transferase WcaK-like protein
MESVETKPNNPIKTQKRILLVGLTTERNLGDRIIAECAEFLFRQATLQNPIDFQWVDLAGCFQRESVPVKIIRKIKMIGFWATRRFLPSMAKAEIESGINRQCEYFSHHIDHVDLIVIVGGGIIKFKTEFFHYFIPGLVRAAEKNGTSIMINAAGVEGYDNENVGCQALKKALNSAVVKVITTRDDIETLRESYLPNNQHSLIRAVADPAVHAARVYGIKRDENSKIIGVGLIRGGIFKSNGIPFRPSQVEELYINLIAGLERAGRPYKLFTNGLPTDFEMGEKILQRLGRGAREKGILVPQGARDLVNIIASFQGIVAARLHACITAFSLGVPAIGIVWNEKMTRFGKNIGHPDRFLAMDRITSKALLEQLERTLGDPIDGEQSQHYKATIFESVGESLTYCGILSARGNAESAP